MPPSAGRSKKRPNQYFNVGEQGRRTGLTLRETGKRDEYGLEPIDGIFSSPALTAKPSGRKSTDTIATSEDMDVEGSSAPEPAEVLLERSVARNASSVRRPPVGRSPMKTSIGATPRKMPSMGAASSARPSMTPGAVASSSGGRNATRVLDFSEVQPQASSKLRSVRKDGSATKPRPDIYDLPPSSPRLEADQQQDELDSVPADDLPAGDDVDDAAYEDDIRPVDDHLDLEPAPAEDDLVDEVPPAQTEFSSPLREKSRNARKSIETPAAYNLSDPNDVSGLHDIPEEEEVEDDEHPSKRTRLSPVDEQERAPARRGRKPKQETKRKARPPPRAIKNGERRPAQHMRSETPHEDDAAPRTRAGRITYKPLEFWKGERAVFKPHSRLETIQEIIRVDEVTPVKRVVAAAKSGAKSQRKTKRRVQVYEDEDEPDEEEEWEQNDGVVTGLVRAWDAAQEMGLDDEQMEQELALAASRIEARDVADSDFRFAKTMTLPFFGSGVVELPPGGFKKLKNTRKMQMVFFVHYGRVTVRVSETSFVITKGGIWQVPRGNFYSIQNETDSPAKIFFAQGCEVFIDPEQILTSPEKLREAA